MIDFSDFPLLSLESLSVTSIQYVCHLYEENKSGSIVNELQYRMFTKKKFEWISFPINFINAAEH